MVTQTFNYSCSNASGQSASALLTVNIIGNPVDPDGSVILTSPTPYEDVDIEFNNRSKQATPLTSARTIKGSMYMPTDKDWFILHSSGNEVIKLELCPQGSTCFNKKSWIVYVFDRDLLTPQIEEQSFSSFRRWVDDTGSTTDLLKNQIIPSFTGESSNHMYLAYRSGYFGNPDANINGPLIGIIDSCFGTRKDDLPGLPIPITTGSDNTVEFGVPPGAKDYLIAVSTPLHGDADGNTIGGHEFPTGNPNECGRGSVLLKKPGLSAVGDDRAGLKKSYTTTEEYISIVHSDDQYAIRVTGTGQNPLLSEQAIANSATLSTASANYNSEGELFIPKLKVGDTYYQAILSRIALDSSYNFGIVIEPLTGSTATVDPFQATYNPTTQEVLIPRVTLTDTGEGYSVIMKYHPATGGSNQWVQLVKATLIK